MQYLAIAIFKLQNDNNIYALFNQWIV